MTYSQPQHQHFQGCDQLHFFKIALHHGQVLVIMAVS